MDRLRQVTITWISRRASQRQARKRASTQELGS